MKPKEFISKFEIEPEDVSLQDLIERNVTNGLGFSRSYLNGCKHNYGSQIDEKLRYLYGDDCSSNGRVNETFLQDSLSFMNSRGSQVWSFPQLT